MAEVTEKKPYVCESNCPECSKRCIANARHMDHVCGSHIWPHEHEVEQTRITDKGIRPGPTGRKRGEAAIKDMVNAVPPEPRAAPLRNFEPGSLGSALTRVESGASEEFKAEAKELVRAVAEAQEYLTTEDVLDLMTSITHDNRAMGPIMLWAKNSGLIAKTEPERFVPSRYPDRHVADLRVWRSLVYAIEASQVPALSD